MDMEYYKELTSAEKISYLNEITERLKKAHTKNHPLSICMEMKTIYRQRTGKDLLSSYRIWRKVFFELADSLYQLSGRDFLLFPVWDRHNLEARVNHLKGIKEQVYSKLREE